MASQRFAASVANMTRKTADNLRYVAMMAIQDVMEAAQTPQPSVKITGGSFELGKIPVDTSELIQSLKSSTSGGALGMGSDSYAVALAQFEVGDVLRFEWTAPYAIHMERGFTHVSGKQVPGRYFVGQNAARFSDFVADRVREVNGK